jgi:hypothetical protein
MIMPFKTSARFFFSYPMFQPTQQVRLTGIKDLSLAIFHVYSPRSVNSWYLRVKLVYAQRRLLGMSVSRRRNAEVWGLRFERTRDRVGCTVGMVLRLGAKINMSSTSRRMTLQQTVMQTAMTVDVISGR